MNKPFPRREVVVFEDAVAKAHAAGCLVRLGGLVVYGIGSNQGSWPLFSNIEFRGGHSVETMRMLAWFVDVHNVKRANYAGKTPMHRRFCLTHRGDEVDILAGYLGVEWMLEAMVAEVEDWDEEHGLEEDMEAKGWVVGVDDWEVRTKKLEFPLSEMQDTVMEAVTGRLMAETEGLGFAGDRLALLSNAFIEGLGGLTLGADDLIGLMAGGSIAEGCHVPVAVAA